MAFLFPQDKFEKGEIHRCSRAQWFKRVLAVWSRLVGFLVSNWGGVSFCGMRPFFENARKVGRAFIQVNRREEISREISGQDQPTKDKRLFGWKTLELGERSSRIMNERNSSEETLVNTDERQEAQALHLTQEVVEPTKRLRTRRGRQLRSRFFFNPQGYET